MFIRFGCSSIVSQNSLQSSSDSCTNLTRGVHVSVLDASAITNDLDKGIRRDTFRDVIQEAGQTSQPRQMVETLCVRNNVGTMGNMLEEPFEELHDGQ